MLKMYTIYIKDQGNGGDYERSCVAKNKAEAVRIFTEMVNRYNEYPWDEEQIEQFVTQSEDARINT